MLSASGASKDLTLTGLYNVMHALREGRALTTKEQSIHTRGIVTVLKELHDELDTAVLAAYGWSDLHPSTDSQVLLTRLLVLNTQRAADEAKGIIHWLRPDFQNPPSKLSNKEQTMQVQQALEVDLPAKNLSKKEGKTTDPTNPKTATPWPATLPEQISAVAQLLTAAPTAFTLTQIEAAFKGRGQWKKSLPVLLQTLEAVGKAQRSDADGVTVWRG